MSGALRAARDPQAMPDAKGRYGAFGGRFVPETLVPALDRLQSGIDPFTVQNYLLDVLKRRCGDVDDGTLDLVPAPRGRGAR